MEGVRVQIRILLVDDEELVRSGVRALLDEHADLHVVAEASDGQEAVRRALETKPDVVVMNVLMPGMNGIEATRRISHELPGVGVLCLSSHSDAKLIHEAICAGASGYVLKGCAFDELQLAIRAVARGQSYLSPAVASHVLHEYRDGNTNAHGSARPVPLTPREREVLQLIAEGEPTVEIARRLQVSVKTVGTHREHIMHKLGIYSVAGLTKYAVREGLTALEA